MRSSVFEHGGNGKIGDAVLEAEHELGKGKKTSARNPPSYPTGPSAPMHK